MRFDVIGENLDNYFQERGSKGRIIEFQKGTFCPNLTVFLQKPTDCYFQKAVIQFKFIFGFKYL
jgi:hypothetical protein